MERGLDRYYLGGSCSGTRQAIHNNIIAVVPGTRQAIHNNSSVIGRNLAVEVLYFGDERVVVVAYIKMFRGNCNRRV